MASQAREVFLARVDPAGGLERMLDHLPDVYFWVKDARGVFVMCNRAFLSLVGRKAEAEVIGRRDADFFPPDLCENYARDDRAVFESGRPLVDKIELVRNTNGSVDWHTTTKTLVRDRRGRGIAVAG